MNDWDTVWNKRDLEEYKILLLSRCTLFGIVSMKCGLMTPQCC